MVLLLSIVTSKTHHGLSLRQRFTSIVSNLTSSFSAAPSSSVHELRQPLPPWGEKKSGDHQLFNRVVVEKKKNAPLIIMITMKQRRVTSPRSSFVIYVLMRNQSLICSKRPECLRAVLPREVIVRWECGMFESLTVGSVKTYGPFKDCSVLLVKDGGVVVTSAECSSCHRLFCAQFATQFAIAEYSQPVPQSQPQALANNTTTSPPLADSGDVFFDVWGSVRQGQGKLITSGGCNCFLFAKRFFN
ncbi:hypothetical protein D0Y65_030601 [Glycine soja]|uniref:Uncharacterized protein n=1 Tax=Glycine soja TaxID=3848 RepID=A0A445I480_GLYSO|nr:hypothetical protein D0Y65_030601 [Glycine soja]